MPQESSAERLSHLARAGWGDVSDRILAGLSHDLNGRVTALAGMVQLMQLDDDTATLAIYLEQEVVRLEESVRLVRRLAGESDEEPEPLHLPEVLPELMALAGKHRHQESVEATLDLDPGLLPVVSRWTLLSRSFLLLMSLAGHESLRRGRTIAVSVAPGEDHCAHLVARIEGAVDDSIAVPEPAALASGMPGITSLLDGSWDSSESSEVVELRISLPMMGRKSG